MASLLQRARLFLAHKLMPAGAGARMYAAAQVGRMTADWVTSNTSADAEIRSSIRRMLDRSRSLERDNDYVRGFLISAQRNINGSHKFDLRMDCGEYRPQRSGPPLWEKDPMADRIISEAWTEWGKVGSCTICKQYNWRGVKRMGVRQTIRDGSFIMRKIVGPQAGNRFQFALQLWEVDHLDLEKFVAPGDRRNEVRFGIEYDSNKAPVAYWLRARHPGDVSGLGMSEPIRFPASEIYHVYLPDRTEQSIGVPWFVAAITRLRQLGAFEEAATIAARLGASKAAVMTKGTDGGVGAWNGPTDGSGRAIMDITPGSVDELPPGWDMKSIDWDYPNIETGDFRKAMLRGVATGLGATYTTIGNDLEAVNFSSARVGLFDEREGWKEIQLFFNEHAWERVFADWLEAGILAGAIKLPLAKFAKFNRPVFKSRRWAMIDPQREIEALKTAIALRVDSRRSFVENQGGDIEEVFHDNKDDEEFAEEIDLDLYPPDPGAKPATAAPAGNAPGKPGKDDEEDAPKEDSDDEKTAKE